MSKPKYISEAPESNAGDDFHRLWAARKSLNLLNFDEHGLKKVVVEGVDSIEANELDPTGEKFLAVDLTEYFGGEDFDHADKVVFSQLKYSTRRENETYTLSKLCQGKKGNPAKSILGKLASVCKQYLVRYGHQSVQSKVKVKLVTNRPVDVSLIQQLKAIQNVLTTRSDTSLDLLKEEFPDYQKLLEKLNAISSLSSKEFTIFLQILDFEDADAGSRFEQRNHITSHLARLDSKNFLSHFRALYVLTNDLMMPENRNNNEITIDNIVFAFNLGSVDRLFPAPPKFEVLDVMIERTQIDDVAQQIIDSTHAHICLHGMAGVGKTSVVRSLPALMPDHSICITYDCYGQGSYLNSDELRHLPANAVMQMCTELVKSAGTDFLLATWQNQYDFARELKLRIMDAAGILSASYPNALIIFFIDAADNSVVAANTKGQPCFVDDMVGLGDLPSNCRFVYSTRTGRKGSLNIPSQSLEIQISPFNENETEAHIKTYFPDINRQEVEHFHQLTKGIPRVQYYSLQKRISVSEVFEFLEPYGKSVGTLIDGQVEEASIRLGDQSRVKKLLSSLIELPRPIPTNFASKASKVSADEIEDFCNDLSSGLIVENGLISFRDEDFETHLQKNNSFSDQELSFLSNLFLDEAEQNPYAASNLGETLYKSNDMLIKNTPVVERFWQMASRTIVPQVLPSS